MRKRKLTITTILIGIVLIGGGAILGLNSYFGESSNGFSSSLLPDWKYRRPITISGHTQDLTDYQVKIELPASLTSSLVSGNKLQSDFDDIRFTDADDNQLLNFWIETATTTATSTIWVKVPSLSANKSSVIYMYYGNSSASSASDGDSVFEFFDDFEGTGINTAKWDIYLPDQFTVSNGKAKCVGAAGFPNLQTSNFQREAEESLSVEVKINVTSLGGGAYSGFALVFTTADQSNEWWTGASDGVGWYAEASYDRYVVFDGSGSWKPGDNRGLATGEIREAVIIDTDKIIHRASGARTFDDTFSGTTNSVNAMPLRIFFTYGGYTIECDWILVRKYADPEPTATVGDEEENITPTAHWRFDEGSGSTAYDSTSNNNDCTWSGSGSHWTNQGKFNGGAIFNGTDDYLSCQDVGNIKTISFWVKLKSLTQSIIDLNGTQTITLSNGQIQAQNFTSPTIYVDGKVSSTLPDTNWHHIAITTESAISASNVYLGKVGSNYFDGILDDVRLYNYVRSPDEIRLDYNAGLAVKLGGSPSTKPAPPQVLWRFEEGSATTVCNNPVFLDGYSYERPISISGSSENLTDYQVLVTIDTANLISQGKLKSDCSDLRFTDSSGVNTIPYWIESGCNTTSTKIWVKVPSIPTNGTTIYLYYGNPSASSASDGDSVFEFFDDFSNSDEWEVSDGISIDTANKKLVATNVDRSGDDRGSYKNDIGIDGGSSFKIHGSFKWTGSGGNCAFACGIASAKENARTVDNLIGFYFHDEAGGSDMSLRAVVNDVGAGSPLWDNEDHFNVLYNYVIIKNGNNLEAKLWDSSHSEENPSFTASLTDKDFSGINFVTWQASNHNTGHSGSGYYFSGDFYNPIFVRKYASPEPTATVGSEISKSDYAKATISGATFATGKFGKALKFDGANDYLATQSALNSQSQFSYSLWFQSSDGEYSTNEYLFNQGTDDPSAYIDNNGNLNIKINSSLKCQISNSNLKSQKWNHLEITGDTSTLKVYFNGALVCTANYTGSTANAVLYLGSASSTTGFFGGKIDDFRIYPYARTPQQVKIDYNAGFGIKLGGSPTNIFSGSKLYPEWKYRKPINISGSSESLTDYQILITLDTASLISDGKMKSDCSDIRFADADDNQTLPYWIEGPCNDPSTKIWVKVSSIPTNGTTIYLYYGNPSAGSASDSSVCPGGVHDGYCCEFFDDFEPDSDKWTGTGTYGTTNEGYASASQTGNGTSTSTLLSNVIGSGDFKVTLKIKSTGSAETGCSYEHKLIQVNSAGETVLDSNAYADYTEKTYTLSGSDIKLKLDVTAVGSSGTTTNTLILRPNGAGSETSISYQYPSSGSHYDKVDEGTADDDSTYVWTDTASWERDLYALEDTSQTGDIEKIKVYWRVICYGAFDCGACDATQASKPSIRTHNTTYDGSEIHHYDACENYYTYSQEWTTNPYTGNAWTWDEINSLEAGVNLYAEGEDTGNVHLTQVYVEVYYSGSFNYTATSSVYVDDVRVRKYADPEPSATVGDEQSTLMPQILLHFGEGSGSTAYDATAHNNDCSLSGTSFKKGILGTGLYFSGSASSSCGNIGNIKTLSFFVNPLSLNQPILDLDGGTNYIELSSGKIHLAGNGWQSPKLYVNGKKIPLDENNYSINTLSQAQWYHIEIVNSTSTSASALTLGKVGTSYFVGTLDELRAYNYQRTPGQVKVDFNSGVGIRFK